MNSSESLEMDSILSESGTEDNNWISPKIVKVSEKGFFASWFNTVDPTRPIREDEYFWPSGQPLEIDNFEDDEFDAYLATIPQKFDDSDGLAPLSFEEMMSVTSDDSAVEMLSVASDVSDWATMPPVLPPLGDLNEEIADDLIPVPIMRKVSDWNEMPPLLPPLPGKVIKGEKSDWSVMPPVLPPLNVNPVAMSPMIPQYSTDWSEMPEPLLPVDLARNRSRPIEIPSQTPEIMAPAPLIVSASEPTPSFSRPQMQPAISWNPTSTFVPFGSNDNTITAFECHNMVPSLHIPSPRQQFAVPQNLPQISWRAESDEMESLEFLELEWDYKDSTQSSPDRMLEYDVHCDHGSLVTSQNAGPTLVNQNLDLPVANPETALVLYQTNKLAPNVESSRKATEQFTTYFMGEYKVIVSNIPMESISVPVKSTNQVCHTTVFPYIAVDSLGKSHYGFHFQSNFTDIPFQSTSSNCYN